MQHLWWEWIGGFRSGTFFRLFQQKKPVGLNGHDEREKMIQSLCYVICHLLLGHEEIFLFGR